MTSERYICWPGFAEGQLPRPIAGSSCNISHLISEQKESSLRTKLRSKVHLNGQTNYLCFKRSPVNLSSSSQYPSERLEKIQHILKVYFYRLVVAGARANVYRRIGASFPRSILGLIRSLRRLQSWGWLRLYPRTFPNLHSPMDLAL